MPRRRADAASTGLFDSTGIDDAAGVAARRGILNHGGLFSPYYLFDVMSKLHREELHREDVDDLASTVRSVVRRAARRLQADSSRAETWTVLEAPVLEALGFDAVPSTETVSTASGDVPVSHVQLDDGDVALVLVDAHPVGTDLEHDRHAPAPGVSVQPIELAFEAALDAHPTARWGLLTNGGEVRLYRKGGPVARQYLAAVLPALVDGDLRDEWTAFFACFRRESLAPGADGRAFVDRVLAESGQHARRIADDLRENVRDAVEALARGVIAQRRNWVLWGGHQPNRDVARRLFRESLYLLYRILFIAFAEAHELLPASTSRAYRETYSFEHLRDVCDSSLAPGGGDETYLWDALSVLFRLVRDGYGSPESGLFILPPLGGELFDPGKTPILSGAVVADRYMHAVVRALSLDRSGRRGAPSRFSYLDLGVDQLGSVYEGLLAYEADIATEPMVEARLTRNGKPIGDLLLVPRASVERSRRLVAAGEEELPASTFIIRAQGARRKASGSYYTPSPLARVMVQKALEPLVMPIIEGCGARDASGKAGRSPDEILGITVIDQAMGSGAFLVHAVHLLADAYREALQASGAPEERLDPMEMAAIKRLVAQRCVYGIDLNPMAVELAKVSLWLETLAASEPLSFLDAHLRCGNALMGAPDALEGDGPRLDHIPDAAFSAVRGDATPEWKRIMREARKRNASALRTLERDAEHQQEDILKRTLSGALSNALERLRHLHGRISEMAATHEPVTVKQALEARKAAAYAEELAQPTYTALREVADLWCAIWFWPETEDTPAPDTWQYRDIASELLAAAREDRPTALAAAQQRQRIVASEVGAERRFLHRWLEFPDVEAAGGYSVVVGNPPWETVNSDRKEFFAATDAETLALEGRALDARIAALVEEMPDLGEAWDAEVLLRDQEATYLAQSGMYTWRSGAGGYVNTYQLFFERGVRDLAPGGGCALVLAGAFVLKANAAALRRAAFTQYRLRFLILSDNERKTYPGIDHRVEFCFVHVTREPSPADLPCRFLVGKLEDGDWRSLSLPDLVALIERMPEGSVNLPLAMVRAMSPETLAPPTVTSPRDAELLRRLYARFPRFSDPASGWTAEFGAEIHSSGDRDHFVHRDDLLARGGVRVGETRIEHDGRVYVPLLEGRNIWQLVYGFTDPKLWISDESVRDLLRPQAQYGGMRSNATMRVAWRDVARIIDRRTMVAGILPAGTTSKDKLPYVRAGSLSPRRMVCLAGLWTSFAFDWQMRTSGIGAMKFGPLLAQPVPTAASLDYLMAVAIAALQPDWLRCQAEDACETRAEQLEWWRARARMDAEIFGIVGLSLEEAAYVLSSFPQLDREQPALAGEDRSTVTRDLVLAEYAALRGTGPADINALFEAVDRRPLGGTGDARERSERALAAGALPYVEVPQADQARQWAEDTEEDEVDADVSEEVHA